MFDANTNPPEHPFLFNSGADQTRITSDNNYDTWQPMNYASRAQKTAQNYSNYRSWNSMGARINDSTIDDHDEYDSSASSPPLWKTTSRVNNYRNLSPASRTQAIARGQRELMEMVKNMPESCYELSLKDLVERKPMADQNKDEDHDHDEEEDASTEILVRKGGNGDGDFRKKKGGERKKMVVRSGSIDSGGFLLKMVFPISLGSKKNSSSSSSNNNNNKNTNNNNTNSKKKLEAASARVSPKPQVENEWWKMKRFSVSERSESGVSSINSGSLKSTGSSSSSTSCSSRSSSRRKTGGCWSFIRLRKNIRRD